MKILKNIIIQESNTLTSNFHRYKPKTLKKIAC